MQEIKIPEGCKASIDFEKRVVVIESERSKFKRGDIVISSYFILPFIGINENEAILFNCYYDIKNRIAKVNDKIKVGCGYIYEYRLATPSEAQLLFDALAKEGKKWNAKTLQIEDIEKDILVPESVGIYKQESWNGGDDLLISFNGGKQILGYNTDTGQWFVKSYFSGAKPIQCKLTPCKREYLKVGDTVYIGADKNAIDNYYKFLGDLHLVRPTHSHGIWIESITPDVSTIYKVEPINK